MKGKALIFALFVILIGIIGNANALNINLETLSGDNSLTIDATVTEFDLNLTLSLTPVTLLIFEKRFSIPDPFDLVSSSVYTGDIQDWGTYFRSLFLSLPDPIEITDPIIATLAFSVDPNALGGDYIFSQVGGSESNGYAQFDEGPFIPFQSNSFTVTIDKPTASVPEPATLLLLASGLAGLVAFRRKFKRG